MSDFLSKVPTLDISKFKSDDENLVKEFSNALGTSFNQTGFAIIKNHGLTNEMTNDLYDAIKSFFNTTTIPSFFLFITVKASLILFL